MGGDDEVHAAAACAYVLAGGASRRMGRDKLGLLRVPAAEESILEHVIGCALEVARDVIVLTAADGCASLGRYAAADNVQIMADRELHQGPLQALSRAWKRGDGDRFVIAGDLPGLSPRVLRACVNRLTALRALRDRTRQDSAASFGGSNAGYPSSVWSHVKAPDGVVVLREGRIQPLLGCYDAEAGWAWRAAAEAGEKRIMRAIEGLDIATIDSALQAWPAWLTRPVHTPTDYQEWLDSCAESNVTEVRGRMSLTDGGLPK